MQIKFKFRRKFELKLGKRLTFGSHVQRKQTCIYFNTSHEKEADGNNDSTSTVPFSLEGRE